MINDDCAHNNYAFSHSTAIAQLRPTKLGHHSDNFSNARWNVTKAQVHYLKGTVTRLRQVATADRDSCDIILSRWEMEGFANYHPMDDDTIGMPTFKVALARMIFVGC